MLPVALLLAATALADDVVVPPVETKPQPSYHIVGALNTFIPGGGRLLLGDYWRSGAELTGEVGLGAWGYSLSKLSPLTLDGVPEELPVFSGRRRRSSSFVSIEKPLYADLLQEAAIKGHLVNTFDAYREAARRQGVTKGIDQKPIWDLFLEPFRLENLLNPWVYAATAVVAGATYFDYVTHRGDLPATPRLTPYSNFLYSVNYEVWQPIGSGAPEEMFFRGFLQHELYRLVPSPLFSIPLTTAAFAFSHAPGPGRLSAAVAGAYLGFLAHKYEGALGPGITLHFWSVVMLGIETVLLSHDSQHTSPPAALAVQINY